MTRLTFVTVALAAGLSAIAPSVHAEPAATAVAAKQEPQSLSELFARKSAEKENTEIDHTTTASIAGAKAKPAAKGRPFEDIVARHAAAHGVSPALVHAVITVESNYRADARGRAGEIGLMQIKPATARMMGYSGSNKGLYDPETNIRYGLKYLAKAQQLGGGDTCGTILRYNAGHGAKRMNKISAAYCAKVKRQLGQS
jgi:soluble lytic murein transglycosylase-like protein